MPANQSARIAGATLFLCTLLGTTTASAQLGVGTWTRQADPKMPGEMTMTVEECCNGGRRLTYRFSSMKQIMTVESPFNGQEVPVLLDGKPSGETMAITRLDPRHTSTIIKMNGKPFGTSKAELSADGRTITVENEFSASVGGNPAGRKTEVWTKK